MQSSILWKDKINQWKNGIPQKCPSTNDRFFYETSACDKNMNNVYEENFILSNELNKITDQDYSPFNQHILNTKNKDAVSFFNISGDTILVVPIPRKINYIQQLRNLLILLQKVNKFNFGNWWLNKLNHVF
jgi:hypothetical protein